MVAGRPDARGTHHRAGRSRRASPQRTRRARTTRDRPAQAGGRVPRHDRPRAAGPDSLRDGDMSTTTSSWVQPLPPGRSARIGALRVGYEVRAYFRQPDTLFFTFLFPVLMLAIFATAFSSQEFGPPGDQLSAAAYYLPGMLAAGILLSGLQNLGVDIAVERSDGTLKRYAGSPMPIGSYFMGKMGQVAVTASLQAAVLIFVAWAVWSVELPSTPEAWGTFAWVFVRGVSCSAVLGIAVSALPRSGKSAQSVIVPIALVLQFVSGVYISFNILPEWLQHVA